MPIYEFSCTACDHMFDEIVPMGTTERSCPRCGTSARKSAGSYKFAAHGLENGHIAVGRKLTGKDSGSSDSAGEGSKPEAKTGVS